MLVNNSDITQILQQQINTVSANGGGSIHIPAGLYHIRPLELKSHINLHLEAGARLLASGKREDYAPIGYHHNEMGDVHSVLYALDQEDISITGAGIIDLNSDAFYHPENPAELPSVGPEVTQAYLDEAPRSHDWRVNQPIFFHQCHHIRIEGITVRNAPCWTITCNFSHSIKMLNLTIENSLIIPNSDGMHFCGSSDIIISGCHITAGDDCVAFTSITDWQRPCENIVVSDCIFQSGSKAISIGYMHSIVRKVLIENIIVKKSNRAFVCMCHPHTGLVQDVQVSNCILEGRSYGGNWWGNGEPIVVMATPHHIDWYRDPQPEDRFDVCVDNMRFDGLTCRAERPVAVVASEDGLCRGIHLHNSTITIVDEEKPSLMGNVVDLSPGEMHFEIDNKQVGLAVAKATVEVKDVVNETGQPITVLEA